MHNGSLLQIALMDQQTNPTLMGISFFSDKFQSGSIIIFHEYKKNWLYFRIIAVSDDEWRILDKIMNLQIK